MTSYILGPNPTTQFTDNNGLWVAGGFVVTKDWNTRLPKATYYDPDGLVLRPNPFPLDSVGRQSLASQPVYYADDEPYYLQLLDANMVQIWESAYPYYPGSANQSKTNSGNDSTNLFINGQMRFFPKSNHSPIPTSITNVADGGWSFKRNGTDPTSFLKFTRFLADNIDIDASPTFYINVGSTSPGTGQTLKTLYFTLQDVRTLAGEEITVGWNVESKLGGTYTLSVDAIQNFGTGGSPSPEVTTNIMTINPTTSAKDYTGTITLPDLSGKTIGTHGNDEFIISFTFPLNINSDIQATNFYLKRGAAVSNYPYISYAEVNTSLIQNPASRWFDAAQPAGSLPIGTGVFTPIPLAAAYNPQGWFNNVVYGFQPTSSGLWQIMLYINCGVDGGGSTKVAIALLKNGIQYVGATDLMVVNDELQHTSLIYLTAGDTVQFGLFPFSTPLTVSNGFMMGALIVN